MTVVGILSFESTQRAICQIVGQWILFHYFRQLSMLPGQVTKSQIHFPTSCRNDKMLLHQMKWWKIPPNGWYLSKIFFPNQRLVLCCHGIKSMLSWFCNGKIIQTAKFWGIQKQSFIRIQDSAQTNRRLSETERIYILNGRRQRDVVLTACV